MPSKRSPKVAPADEQPKPTPAPFHEVYGLLLVGLPDSVLLKIKARAEVRGLDVAVGEDYLITELLESARSAYERKKLGSRASAARRRAAKKATAAPEAAPEVEPEAAIEAAPADAPAPAEPTPLP